MNSPSGILVIDKPKSMTSHDVVDIVRRLFNTRRVGHAGTLDPIATGVLVVLVGEATGRSRHLSGQDKEYAAVMRLGVTTDTADAFGKVIDSSDTQGIGAEEIREAIMSFKGEIEQVPPMFSAVKFKGKSLYKWARKGVTVHREPRRVIIKELSVKSADPPDVAFDVVCSKGTYIRQLCADIGLKLGCGAHMSKLKRIRSGDFHISQAIGLHRLGSMEAGELRGILRV